MPAFSVSQMVLLYFHFHLAQDIFICFLISSLMSSSFSNELFDIYEFVYLLECFIWWGLVKTEQLFIYFLCLTTFLLIYKIKVIKYMYISFHSHWTYMYLLKYLPSLYGKKFKILSSVILKYNAWAWNL